MQDSRRIIPNPTSRKVSRSGNAQSPCDHVFCGYYLWYPPLPGPARTLAHYREVAIAATAEVQGKPCTLPRGVGDVGSIPGAGAVYAQSFGGILGPRRVRALQWERRTNLSNQALRADAELHADLHSHQAHSPLSACAGAAAGRPRQVLPCDRWRRLADV